MPPKKIKEIKIKTPYGIKNWSYIQRLMDEDTARNFQPSNKTILLQLREKLNNKSDYDMAVEGLEDEIKLVDLLIGKDKSK